MGNLLRECNTFFREWRDSTRTVGAIVPSGRFLARAIASQLRHRNGPMRVLEVGPGTGALTGEIVRHIGPRDRFDIVEVNGQFVAALKLRFRHEWHFRRVADRTRILHMPVQDLNGERAYDYVISGLPLNILPTASLREILQSFDRLIAPGGVLSYFEYLWLRDVSRLFVSDRERLRLRRVGWVMDAFVDRFEFRRETVWVNLPPALVHHLRLDR